MNRCDQELCRFWTGQGCICSVLDLKGDDEPECPRCGSTEHERCYPAPVEYS